jgi:tRNA A-37 threonylcarbamoyl transferase component Bud32
MMEKSVVAASDKLEMCKEKVKQTEKEVKAALEKKYSSKALAESIERERHAEEMRFLSNKYRGDDVNFSAVHDNDKVLHDAHKLEHEAELQLEKAIEEDIASKKDLEHMIENKAALKEVLHEMQEIIHEHAALAMEKERARKSKY